MKAQKRRPAVYGIVALVVVGLISMGGYYGYAIKKIGEDPLKTTMETLMLMQKNKIHSDYPYVPNAIEAHFYVYRTAGKDLEMMQAAIQSGFLIGLPDNLLSSSSKKRIMRFYFDRGVDINGPDGSILFPALTLADTEMVEWLLEQGADPHREFLAGKNALEWVRFLKKEMKEKKEKWAGIPPEMAQIKNDVLEVSKEFEKRQDEIVIILERHMEKQMKKGISDSASDG